MAINKISASQYFTMLQQAIQSRTLSHDTVYGAIPDIVERPASVVFELQNNDIRSVQQLQALVNDGSWQLSDLTAFVYNEELIPLTGSNSLVTLVFFRATMPSTNVTVQGGFPVGSTPDQSTGATLIYTVLQTTTLIAANAASYFNPITQRYELPVTAACTITGSGGVVGSTRLTQPIRPLVGFDGVTNPSGSSQPQDPETIPQLSTRYLISLPGSSPAVTTGITKILRDNYPQVISSYVVQGNNPYLTRAAFDAGAVDVWIQGSVPQTIIATIPYLGVGQLHVLPSQPVLSITSIQNGATTYTQNTDYVLTQDQGPLSHSVRGQDGFTFLAGGAGAALATGTPLTVTYVQETLVTLLQTAFQQLIYYFPGRDILFRAGIAQSVVFAANYHAITGFVPASIGNLLSNSIYTYINSLQLGIPLQAFSLDEQAAQIAGVGNFVITTLATNPPGTGNADILPAPYAYLTINATDISLTPI